MALATRTRPVSSPPSGYVLVAIIAPLAALTLLFTYPIWTAPNTTLTGLGDDLHQAWILAWDAHALRADPTAIFDTNTFYPRKNTLALSENLLASAIVVAPINWAGRPILAYNIVLVASFFLSGLGMALWVRHLTSSVSAGLLAGVIWAFAPVKFGQLSHLQMLTGQWVPFAFLAVTRYIETARTRYALGAALLYSVQFLSSLTHGLMLLPCLALYAVASLGMRSCRVPLPALRVVRDLVVGGVLTASILWPMLTQYQQVRSAEGYGHELEALIELSARPTSFISPSGFNRVAYMQPLSQAYTTAEANLYPGIVVYLLLCVGMVWLLPQAWRGRWPGHDGVNVGGDASTTTPGGLYARRLRQGACVLTATLALLHVIGVLLAVWAARPVATDWLLTVARHLQPTLWLAPSAAVLLVLWRWTTPNAARPARVFMTVAFLGLVTYLLSYGPTVRAAQVDLGHGPYWFLYQTLSPYQAMRSIARFGIYWMLFVAAWCGLVLDASLARLATLRPSWAAARQLRFAVAVTTLLVALVVAEYRVWPLPAFDVDPGANPVDHWLAEQPADTTVLHVPVLPLGAPANQGAYLIGSTLHWKRMVNGYASFLPREFTRLAQTRDYADFYRQVRRNYPLLDYVIVHGDKMSDEEFVVYESRILADRENFSLVTRFGNILVFRPKLDWDQGADILRRFPPEELAEAAMRLQARAPARDMPRSVALVVRWGNQRTQRTALTKEWTDVDVTIPPVPEVQTDGTVHVRFQSGYVLTPGAPARAIGTTGYEIRADVLVDAQLGATRLAINNAWEAIDRGDGWQVYELTDAGTRLGRSWSIGSRDAVDGLKAMIGDLEPGVMVAVGVSQSRARRLGPMEGQALREIGVVPPTEPLHTLAVIGVKGSIPGSALVESHGMRSFVQLGERAPLPQIRLRRIRLEPSAAQLR